MRFSRHVKNEMRRYEIPALDVEAVAKDPGEEFRDDHGNHRLCGADRDGRAIIVIVANDGPDFVITTFPDG